MTHGESYTMTHNQYEEISVRLDGDSSDSRTQRAVGRLYGVSVRSAWTTVRWCSPGV